MADITILNGDIGVTYFANNRQKRMEWIGGTNDTYTINELYSAMATLMDQSTTIDDGTAFSAETPVEYTTGKIDSGEIEPWYIEFDLMEHITSGALRTTGWTRVQDSNTGIVMVEVASASNAIVQADVGNDITHTDTDSGTLLEVLSNSGTSDYLIIRPDSSAIGNSFDNTTGTLTCNAHTATSITTAASTGEMIWANVYSIGTIDPNVHVYLYQGSAAADADRVRLYSWNDNTQDWYSNGHIDTVIPIVSMGSTTWAVIDGGYATAFARKSGDLYASFEVANSTTSGGRNPIPLQTALDLDNPTGIKSIDVGTWTGTYTDGEIITGNTTGARGIVDFSESLANDYIVYHPIDDPQIDFTTGDTVITGASSGATSSAGGGTGTSDYGPADATWYSGSGVPTVAFANTTADINDDGTDEWYGITIDCNQNRLSEIYQWAKWQTRNGEVTNDLDGINGERYIGGEVYLAYASITNAIAEGESLTQAVSGATGVVVSHDTTNDVLLLRDTRGSFDTTNQVDSDDSSGYFTPTVAQTFAPKTASPLGTFAGGTFFGARGLTLIDWNSADENLFILTDIAGGTYTRPQAISIAVTNLAGGAETSALMDLVGVYRLTGSGGSIDKTEYACDGGEAAGASTIATANITQDTPGKSTGGRLVLVDVSDGGKEYVLRYSSWDGVTDTFTLANTASNATAGTTATQVTDSGASFTTTALRGDLIYSSKGVGYVETVDSDTQLTLVSPGITGLTSTDAYEINAVPVLINVADYVYVTLIHRYATAASESVSIIYVSPIYFRVRVRNTRATTKIKPYSSDGSTSGTDQSIPVVRTEDTIIT